jgi:hypothetical protein
MRFVLSFHALSDPSGGSFLQCELGLHQTVNRLVVFHARERAGLETHEPLKKNFNNLFDLRSVGAMLLNRPDLELD